jgi:hypothetical protein
MVGIGSLMPLKNSRVVPFDCNTLCQATSSRYSLDERRYIGIR